MIRVNKLNTLNGHQDAVYTLAQGANPWEFFSGAGDGMVVQWDLQKGDQGRLIANLPTSVYALQYIPQEKTLIIGQNYQGLHLIDPQAGKEIKSLRLTESAIFDIKYHQGLIYMAVGDGSVLVVDYSQWSLLHKIKLTEQSARSIAISPNGEEIAVGYSDNHIRIFSVVDFKLKRDIAAHKNSVFTLSYHPKSPLLLSAGRDAHLNIWQMDKGYELHQTIVAHMFAINHIEFSPNGLHFVTCSMDKSIKVWSAGEFRLLKVIDKARYAGHGTSVNKLYWSTFNNQLASCSDDRTISVWDLKF